MIITIDPAHTKGENVGLYGHSEGTWAYNFAVKLASTLENEGFNTILTRTSTSNPSLESRGKKAEKDGIFISIHSDAGPGSACGATCFYPYDGGKEQIKFAQSLVDACNKGFGLQSNRNTPVQRKQYFLTGKDYYAVMRNAAATRNRYLLECGFHTNAQNVVQLDDSRLNDSAVRLIASVFSQYFPQNKRVAEYTFSVGPATGLDAAEIRAFCENMRASKGIKFTESEVLI